MRTNIFLELVPKRINNVTKNDEHHGERSEKTTTTCDRYFDK